MTPQQLLDTMNACTAIGQAIDTAALEDTYHAYELEIAKQLANGIKGWDHNVGMPSYQAQIIDRLRPFMLRIEQRPDTDEYVVHSSREGELFKLSMLHLYIGMRLGNRSFGNTWRRWYDGALHAVDSRI